MLKKTLQLERKTEDPGVEAFLLFIGSQAFHSSGYPSLSVSGSFFSSVFFSLVENRKRAPCPVIKLMPGRWEREIHHSEALVYPANLHHRGL